MVLGAAALEVLAAAGGPAPPGGDARREAARLLGERSELTGRRPCGPRTAGGAGRLLPGADGWVAVSLPRVDDLDLLPAWLGAEPARSPGPGAAEGAEGVDDEGGVPWAWVARALRARPVADAVAAGQELGLAVAAVPGAGGGTAGRSIDEGSADEQLRARATVDPAAAPVRTQAGERARRRRPLADLVVVDLSSLWAGPTCARLLAGAGARVVKVESPGRPDGARRGDAELFRRLHAGHEHRWIPFDTPAGVAELRECVAGADVVIEGSRPRALERLGIDPAAVVAAWPGAVWVSITAYGRAGPWRQRVGFGDDCAAAAGLVTWGPTGAPAFAGDAVADPLTGMVAAAVVATAVAQGGGVVLDVALREVARAAALGSSLAWTGGEGS